MLVNRKNLAKTSGTPGKTQLINHFKINDQWFLVDLPGYGYAKVSRDKRKAFQKSITDYFLKRRQLACTFLLIDCRHEPQAIDVDFIQFLGENEIPFCLVFTKADKLSGGKLRANMDNYKKRLLASGWEESPPFFSTSATDQQGRDELLDFIADVNESLKSS